MQVSLAYSPVISGVAFLPMVVCIAVAANVSNIVLLPRIGPKPIVVVAFLLLTGGQIWLTRIGVHGDYVADILGPLMVTGTGMGLLFSTAINTGTYGVDPQDAGVASASVNTGQQLGGSIGTSLLNTIAASATTAYIASHLAGLHGRPSAAILHQVQAAAFVHGYTTVFWWCTGLFARRRDHLRHADAPWPAAGHGDRRRARARRGDGGELRRQSGQLPGVDLCSTLRAGRGARRALVRGPARRAGPARS